MKFRNHTSVVVIISQIGFSLCVVLQTNKALKLCDVKYNKLGIPALEAFAEMLNKNDTLEVLKIDFQVRRSRAAPFVCRRETLHYT